MMHYWEKLKKYAKSGKNYNKVAVIVMQPGQRIETTGAGPDGIVQPKEPAQIAHTTNGPVMLHEGEGKIHNQDGTTTVLPHDKMMLLNKRMPGMLTGGTYTGIPENIANTIQSGNANTIQASPYTKSATSTATGLYRPPTIQTNTTSGTNSSLYALGNAATSGMQNLQSGLVVPKTPGAPGQQLDQTTGKWYYPGSMDDPARKAVSKPAIIPTATLPVDVGGTTTTTGGGKPGQKLDTATGKWYYPGSMDDPARKAPIKPAIIPTATLPIDVGGTTTTTGGGKPGQKLDTATGKWYYPGSPDDPARRNASKPPVISTPPATTDVASSDAGRGEYYRNLAIANLTSTMQGMNPNDRKILNMYLQNYDASTAAGISELVSRLSTDSSLTPEAKRAMMFTLNRNANIGRDALLGKMAENSMARMDSATRDVYTFGRQMITDQDQKDKWAYDEALKAEDYAGASAAYQKITGKPLNTKQYEEDRKWTVEQREQEKTEWNNAQYRDAYDRAVKSGNFSLASYWYQKQFGKPLDTTAWNQDRAFQVEQQNRTKNEWKNADLLKQLATQLESQNWSGASTTFQQLYGVPLDTTSLQSDANMPAFNMLMGNVTSLISSKTLGNIDKAEAQWNAIMADPRFTNITRNLQAPDWDSLRGSIAEGTAATNGYNDLELADAYIKAHPTLFKNYSDTEGFKEDIATAIGSAITAGATVDENGNLTITNADQMVLPWANPQGDWYKYTAWNGNDIASGTDINSDAYLNTTVSVSGATGENGEPLTVTYRQMRDKWSGLSSSEKDTYFSEDGVFDANRYARSFSATQQGPAPSEMTPEAFHRDMDRSDSPAAQLYNDFIANQLGEGAADFSFTYLDETGATKTMKYGDPNFSYVWWQLQKMNNPGDPFSATITPTAFSVGGKYQIDKNGKVLNITDNYTPPSGYVVDPTTGKLIPEPGGSSSYISGASTEENPHGWNELFNADSSFGKYAELAGSNPQWFNDMVSNNTPVNIGNATVTFTGNRAGNSGEAGVLQVKDANGKTGSLKLIPNRETKTNASGTQYYKVTPRYEITWDVAEGGQPEITTDTADPFYYRIVTVYDQYNQPVSRNARIVNSNGSDSSASFVPD